MGIIYLLTCTVTGKSYVGQTKYSVQHRFNQHVWEARHPEANQSRKLNNAIIKYGADSFTKEVICWCENDEMDFWEEFFIDVYETFTNGYNLTTGGKVIQNVSDETRAKLSAALKGKPKNVKNNRKRPEDNDLPKYLKCYKDAKSEGYRIADHPALDGGSISFTKSDQTMEQKLADAIEVLKQINEGTYKHQKKDLPKGIQLIPNGYRFRMKGYPVRTFQNSNMSMEEKLELAIKHKENTIK